MTRDAIGIGIGGFVSLDLASLESLLPRYEGSGPRYTSYPTAPVWSEAYGPEHLRSLLAGIDSSDPAGVGVYVHVPFCRELCHYCACNRVITRDDALPERYLEVIEREIGAARDALPTGVRTGQLHLGGGTPTHLSPSQLVRLFDSIQAAMPLTPDAEASIEVDPRVTTDDHIEALEECGFERISLGVQDFDDRVQRAIHRIQPHEIVARLVDRVRRSGFRSINFDLIYGLPHQDEVSFGRTLDRVIELEPDRIALYSYAHVTWVAKQQRGFERKDLPDARRKLQILLLAMRRFEEAGYVQIGMDHFARHDDELAIAAREGTLQRNFMGYTVRPCRDLVAFGPSAISEIEGSYAQSVRELRDWEQRVTCDGLATLRGHLASSEDQRRAWVIAGIMCQGRVSADAYSRAFGGEMRRDFATELESLQPMQDDGLVDVEPDGSIKTSPVGRVLLRNVAMCFDAYLPAQTRSNAPLFSKTI